MFLKFFFTPLCSKSFFKHSSDFCLWDKHIATSPKIALFSDFKKLYASAVFSLQCSFLSSRCILKRIFITYLASNYSRKFVKMREFYFFNQICHLFLKKQNKTKNCKKAVLFSTYTHPFVGTKANWLKWHSDTHFLK